MKHLGSLSSSSARASFSASLTVYVLPASAYPRIDVKGVILWILWIRWAQGLCDNSREAGRNNRETDMIG